VRGQALAPERPNDSRIDDPQDFRSESPNWLNYCHHAHPDERYASRLAALTDIPTANGRTLAQGALAWLWARSPNLIPIPGARTIAHVVRTPPPCTTDHSTPTR
jgi:aryl-alcohol dehydrogenase-like predicted oxidoreductase